MSCGRVTRRAILPCVSSAGVSGIRTSRRHGGDPASRALSTGSVSLNTRSLHPSAAAAIGIASLAVALVALVLSSFSAISDYDFWWHVALGRQVADALSHGSLALPDTFSYTASGAPQMRLEWLGDLVLHGAFDAFGFAGVDALMALLLAGTAVFLSLAVVESLPAEHRPFRLPTVGITLSVFFACVRFRVYPRPALFTWLFLAAFIWLLAAYRARGRWTWLVPLLPLAAVWSNTSKGAVYGLFAVGAFAVASAFSRRLDRPLWLACAGVAAALLANPDGPRSLTIFFEYRSALTAPVKLGEFQPLSPMMFMGEGAVHMLGFVVTLLLSIAALVAGGWRRQPATFLLAGALAAQTFLAVRMADLFAVTAAVPVALAVAAALRRWGPARIGAVAVAASLALILASQRAYAFGASFKATHAPAGALEFLRREGIGGRVFNSYPYGGYLASQGIPVFVDGRGGTVYTPEFLAAYLKAIHDREAWDELDARWGFTSAVLEYDLRSLGRHFPRHLSENPAWALVYWDDHSAVFLKRTPASRPVIDRYAYQLFKPSFYDFTWLAGIEKKVPLATVIAMAGHDVELNPRNQEPRLARVFLANAVGSRNSAALIGEVKACLELEPNLAMEHSSLAYLYVQAGDRAAARSEIAKALKMDPRDALAQELKRDLER